MYYNWSIDPVCHRWCKVFKIREQCHQITVSWKVCKGYYLIPLLCCCLDVSILIAAVRKWFALSSDDACVKVSLKCPITYHKIVLPARGGECKHIQVTIKILLFKQICKMQSISCPFSLVLWCRVIPTNELWKRNMEVSCMQVSIY